MQPPVIVVPGITATGLRDVYPVPPEPVWGMVGRDYARIFLHPDDLRFERGGPARIDVEGIFDVPYGELIQELRHDLSEKADEPVPVYAFAYDWRQPLALTQTRFAAFVDEVVERTALLRHYHRDGYGDAPSYDLVGHSMGGLIIAGHLAEGGDTRVRKVATLGTPFRGSFEAVLKVAVGTAALGLGEANSREREAARLTPALYHLVPDYPGAVEAAGDVPADLFDVAAWQPGVIETLAEYIRLHGLDAPRAKRDRMERARTLLGDILEAAGRHRASVEGFDLDSVGMTADDWLAVVGLGEETRVRLRIEERGGEPWFDLASAGRMNGYPTPRRADDGSFVENLWETGDGTVPYAGARPPFLPLETLVCVSDDDFGYWELKDRALEHFGPGLHGMLPAMNVARKLVAAHLKGPAGGRGAAHPGIWGRRAPDLAQNAEWRPPLEGLREKAPGD